MERPSPETVATDTTDEGITDAGSVRRYAERCLLAFVLGYTFGVKGIDPFTLL